MNKNKFRVFFEGRFYYFVIGQSMTPYEQLMYNQCCLMGLEFEQCVGEVDNRHQFYEGDMVNGGMYNGSYHYGVITYLGNSFVAVPVGKFAEGISENFKDFIIVGNKTENKELIK